MIDTNKSFEDTIREEGWNFLKEKGFLFFLQKNSSSYYTSYDLFATKSIEQLKAYLNDKNSNLQQCYRLESYLSNFSVYSNNGYLPFLALNKSEAQTLANEFFARCYTQYPEHQKNLLSQYRYFYQDTSVNKEDYFFSIVDNVSQSTKEKIATVLKFPISTLDLNHLDVKDIERYLVDSGANKNELDKFLFSYFKARKNQLKDSKNGPKMRDYLLSKYSRHSEEIKPYLGFFDSLKALYEAPKADFLINTQKYSTTLIISAKKMKTSFLLDGWEVDSYSKSLPILIRGFKVHYNLEKIEYFERDKTDKTYQINFFHNNENFDRVTFEKDMIDYFSYLFDNQTPLKELSTENFINWLSKKNLYASLSTMEDHTTNQKKNKI